MTQQTHKALLDALAVQPHPLEVERQRVAADDAPIREFESDDWDHEGEQADSVAGVRGAIIGAVLGALVWFLLAQWWWR